jgi:hypothetical protein
MIQTADKKRHLGTAWLDGVFIVGFRIPQGAQGTLFYDATF